MPRWLKHCEPYDSEIGPYWFWSPDVRYIGFAFAFFAVEFDLSVRTSQKRRNSHE